MSASARLAGQIMLEITFTEHRVVEGAKTGGQSPQAADETELGQNPALDRSEADFAGKGEPVFSLFLRLDQRVAGHEIVGVELAAGISRVTDFTDPAGEVEATKQELAPLPDMLSPRQEETECFDMSWLESAAIRAVRPIRTLTVRSGSRHRTGRTGSPHGRAARRRYRMHHCDLVRVPG